MEVRVGVRVRVRVNGVGFDYANTLKLRGAVAVILGFGVRGFGSR